MGVERQIDIAISQSIIDETLRVLRDKFKSTEAELDTAEKVMRSCGRMVELGPQPRVVPDDPNDVRHLRSNCRQGRRGAGL